MNTVKVCVGLCVCETYNELITDIFDAQSDVRVTTCCVNYLCSLESKISNELKRLGSLCELVYGAYAVRGCKTPALCW